VRFRGAIVRLAVGIGVVALVGAAIIVVLLQREPSPAASAVSQLSFGRHGLSVTYTINYFSQGAPGATTLSPDINVPTTAADLLHGVDRVVQEVLSTPWGGAQPASRRIPARSGHGTLLAAARLASLLMALPSFYARRGQ
jgi:hypothetical protein